MKRPAEDDYPMQDPPAHLTNGHNPNFSSLPDKVAIFDCGAQYGKLIDRRVRELSVESIILPLNTPVAELKDQYRAIIISGGPKSVFAGDAPPYDSHIFACGLPVLGICYGFQLINKVFGGTVQRDAVREDGQCEVNIDRESRLFRDLGSRETVLLTHGDSIATVAPGFRPIAQSGNIIAGIADESREIYGLQFHPEVDLTLNGKIMLKNFLYGIAKCKGCYSMKSREEACVKEIKATVKDKKVLVMVSGGVDSTVCAALLHCALGRNKVIALYVDHGLMRKDETHSVRDALSKLKLKTLKEISSSGAAVGGGRHQANNAAVEYSDTGLHLKVHLCKYQFLYGSTRLVDKITGEQYRSDFLCRTVDPEVKRKIIGDTFMKVKDELLEKFQLDPEDVILAQGTLRPDLIESASSLASSHADAIKTHHNDTEFVRILREQNKVIEPLKDFHKDEVRQLGRDLGLPEDIVHRHPFPGPGLAIRILCATEPYLGNDFMDTQTVLRIVVQYASYLAKDHELIGRVAKYFTREELERLKEITERIQFNSTLLPVMSVGVQGDCRSYSYVAAISVDRRAPIPWKELMMFAKLVPKILHNINRMVYVFGPLVEYPVLDITPTLLNDTSISLAQETDALATKILRNSGCMDKISQMPVVLVPVHFDRHPSDYTPSVKWSVCLRTFITNDFMTGIPATPGLHIPSEVVEHMADCLLRETPLLSRILYDLTPKPPGTTEWETRKA